MTWIDKAWNWGGKTKNNFTDWTKSLLPGADEKKYKDQLDRLQKDRPDMAVQQEYLDALNLSKDAFKSAQDKYASEVNQNMPGYDKAKDNISSAVASGVEDIKRLSNSTSGALGATVDLYSDSLKELSGLDIADAQFKAQKKRDLESSIAQERQNLIVAEQLMGDQKQQVFNWNNIQKYGENYNYLQSLIAGANADKNQSRQNLWGFAGGLLNAGSKIATSMSQGG